VGLNGLIPAQVAGIDLNLGRNKWMKLIKLSVDTKNNILNNEEKLHVNQNKNNKSSFIVKVTLNGNEVENSERKLGIKTRFKDYERAKESVEFYKQVYPDLEFKIDTR
jgi:hypothetical protein